jgi:hypothetical protein
MDGSCSALAAMIAQSSLSTLDVSYNPIGEAGTRMLVGALASDTSIHTCVDCAYSLLSRCTHRTIAP